MPYSARRRTHRALPIMLHILVAIMAGSAELVAQEQELAFGDVT
jgi:hypothetical protein